MFGRELDKAGKAGSTLQGERPLLPHVLAALFLRLVTGLHSTLVCESRASDETVAPSASEEQKKPARLSRCILYLTFDYANVHLVK